MEKRKHEADGSPDRKRFRFDLEQEVGYTDEAEFYMEQRLVGWIIGRSGAALKEVEQAYGVKVVLDQASKELGYSKVKIVGARDSWEAAADHINQSLARAVISTDGEASQGPFLLDAPPSSSLSECLNEEMRIEQRFVGWLLGRGGGVVREIEQSSGCKISIKQDTRSQGYSRAVFIGSVSERESARQQIEESLARAKDAAPVDTKHASNSRAGDGELQIDQKWVGWLVGRGGGVMKEMEEANSVRISIDQSTKPQGYSTVKITGEPSNVEAAKGGIQSQLQKVGGTSWTTSGAVFKPDKVEVQQQWVGWLLGKSGAVMKEIEQRSGARIKIDQTTKERGFSTVCIEGSGESVSVARGLVLDELAKVEEKNKGRPAQRQLPAALRQAESWTENAVAAFVEQLGHGKDRRQLDKAREIGSMLASALDPHHSSSSGRGHSSSSGRGRPPLRAPRRESGRDYREDYRRDSREDYRRDSREDHRRDSREESVELQVEQKLVGWILGKSGATMKDIESESGARVSIDQSSKEYGYSIVRMSGRYSAVQKAQQRIQASLALAQGKQSSSGSRGSSQGSYNSTSGGGESEQMEVEQRCVGWLVGTKGVVLKEIEQKSGARVSIDQSTKEQGFSVVRIGGSWNSIESARDLIKEKIAQASKS